MFQQKPLWVQFPHNFNTALVTLMGCPVACVALKALTTISKVRFEYVKCDARVVLNGLYLLKAEYGQWKKTRDQEVAGSNPSTGNWIDISSQ